LSTSVKPNRVGPFPFPKGDPAKRIRDFSEVEQPYTLEQVQEEAKRCLLCGTPVCIDACPVQMDVRGMCEAVGRNDLKTAFIRIRETNGLLGVTARCCPQLQGLCEDACVMRWEGEPISIGMIQRFVSDWEQKQSEHIDVKVGPETGKRVVVVGSGPAGLAAASLLRRYGHKVTIYEELPLAGGTAWYGIPDYHLPKNVLEYEISRIKDEGVEIHTSTKVGKDVMLTQLLSDSTDAVLITTGPKDVVKLDTPGIDLQGIFDGYGFLEDVYVRGVDAYLKEPKYDLGKEVLVVGGGDTALDCGRTAKRLAQGKVTIVYRRDEKEMPADPIMVQEAKEEGVEFKFLSDPKEYNGEGKKLTSCTMNAMKLGEPDSTGRRKPEPEPGKEFQMKCSAVLLAVGRGPNSFLQKQAGIKTGKKNVIAVDDHYRTSMHGVYAAGDVTTGETLVVKAMGSGRNAAQRVHEFLMNIDEKEHVSLFEQYYVGRSYEKMASGKEDEEIGTLPP
jgi:glutamate synthase (NADPH) small chain